MLALAVLLFHVTPATGATNVRRAALSELRAARAHIANPSHLGDASPHLRAQIARSVSASHPRGYDSSGILVRRNPIGRVTRLAGLPYLVDVLEAPADAAPEVRARAFLHRWAGIWSAAGQFPQSLRHKRTAHGPNNSLHIGFQQYHGQIPVHGSMFFVHMDEAGRVFAVNGEFIDDIDDPFLPVLPPADARASLDHLWPDVPFRSAPEPIVFAPSLFGRTSDRPVVCWRFLASSTSLDSAPSVVFVDAISGEIVHTASSRVLAQTMEIWDAGGTPMRGTLRYSLNPFYHYNCLTDINCLTALVGGDEVYDMWIALFNRYGYDGYDGLMDMIYDVDMGQTCQASTDLVDNFTIYHIDAVSTGAVAHENGHLVHESFWNIDQAIPNEPGVVHESFADLHDMWVDSLGTQDWGMEASAACGYPTFVRSYADPPNRDPSQVEYPTPDSYRWYERLNVGTDLGGVHVNVGILNKLAYLLLTTGTNFHHGRPVDGLPGIAEPIFFDAIEYGHYSWYSDIHDYRDGLVAACAVRYGADSYFCGQLENAWEAVGLWSNELSDPFANVGSRPATLSFPADVAPQDGVDDWWLYAFYKDSQSNRIMWRWGEPESNYWGYEKAVELGGHGGSNLYTEDPVALAIWQDKLYVFFRPAGSDSIYYFYMTKSETFYGPWRIKDTTPPVETDRGPAAVSSGQWLTVLYKVKGHQFTRVVRRPPPYGPWTVTAGIAPFWTNDAPFLTTASATVGTRTAVAAAAVRHTGYPSNGIKWAYYDDDVWFTQTGTQGSASVPVGFRQYADTPGDFDFSEPSTCDTPVLVEWGGDLVLAWCETGSPFIFHKVLGLSRGPLSETSGTRVWGPSVWIDQSASEVSPSLLVARNTVGFPVGLWAVFQEYEGDHLYWRESRGEQ